MKRRRKDSGFAMLLVFLLAACVAITLYMEIPRVAFEAERQRELLLVDRGNQFKRAIQVFVTDKTNNPTHRYPASLDELESFNNHRYLRHRYLDPMTGKDEWRLVHINGGILTDSVTTQAKPTAGTQASSGGSTSDYLSQTAFMDTAGGNNAGAGGVTRALNRRPSDTAGAPGDPNNPAGGGAPGAPGDPNNAPGGSTTAAPPTNAGLPGANPPIPPGLPGITPGQPGNPASTNTAQQPCQAYIGSCAPTTPTNNGQPAQLGQPGQIANNGGMPGVPPGVPGGVAGGPGFGIQGNAQNNAQASAAAMIGGLLTTPRPGGMPTGMPGSTTVGGGVAGVASKYEAEGIMVINQRTKINEWEYIFDATKYHAPPNPVAGTVGNQQTPLGQQNGPNGSNSPNGQGNMTTGGQGGFGSGPVTPGTTGHQ